MAKDFDSVDTVGAEWVPPAPLPATNKLQLSTNYEVPAGHYDNGPSTDEELNAAARRATVKALVGAIAIVAGLAANAYVTVRLATERICLGVGCTLPADEWQNWAIGISGALAACAGLAVAMFGLDSRKAYRQYAKEAAEDGYISAGGYGVK